MKLLIINPGSTSTKLALYDGAKKLLQENLEHDAAALQQYHGIGDQVPMRLAVIRDFLDRSGVHPEELAAVIGRGGLVFGLKTGGYLVNEDLCHALVDDDLSQPHASNLGGLLAREIAAPLGIPAYIYDAVTSGELRTSPRSPALSTSSAAASATCSTAAPWPYAMRVSTASIMRS